MTGDDWDHPSVAVWPAEVRRRLRRLQADQGRLTAIAACGADLAKAGHG